MSNVTKEGIFTSTQFLNNITLNKRKMNMNTGSQRTLACY